MTDLQSKYIALHVGLFWGIGIFIIKNEDSIKIKLDEKTMYEQFTANLKIEDKFIQKRVQFIRQLIEQRKLKIEFEMIDKNLAKKILMQKSLRPKMISCLVTACLRCLIVLRIKFIKEVIV